MTLFSVLVNTDLDCLNRSGFYCLKVSIFLFNLSKQNSSVFNALVPQGHTWIEPVVRLSESPALSKNALKNSAF